MVALDDPVWGAIFPFSFLGELRSPGIRLVVRIAGRIAGDLFFFNRIAAY